MKILVSGFEPFGGASTNPTALLLEGVPDSVLLPVEFGRAFEVLSDAIARVRPDAVLALGQAGGRDAVEIERIAINLMDAEIPDNRGYHPRSLPVIEGAEKALFSSLPIDQMLSDLRAAGVPSRISNTAGLYVCNDLFYRLQRLGLMSGFVHVPYLPEQAASTGKPSMPLETMKLALRTMLKTLSAY